MLIHISHYLHLWHEALQAPCSLIFETVIVPVLYHLIPKTFKDQTDFARLYKALKFDKEIPGFEGFLLEVIIDTSHNRAKCDCGLNCSVRKPRVDRCAQLRGVQRLRLASPAHFPP